MKDKEIITYFNKNASSLESHVFVDPRLQTKTFGIGKVVFVNKRYVFIEYDEHSRIQLSFNTIKRLAMYKTSHTDNEFKTKSFDFSYLILERRYLKFLPLLQKLDELSLKKDYLMISIDGYASSGKTTLVDLLNYLYGSHAFHTDDFFKKIEYDKNNPLSIHGSHIDFNKINETIIIPLERKESVCYRPFDFKTHQHLEYKEISYHPFNIIEGAYSMHPQIKANYDFKIFMKMGFLKQRYRILKRNGMKGLFSFTKKWIPKEKRYFSAYKIESKADIIIYV